MVLVFVAVATAVVVAIAFYALGRVTGELSAVPSKATFDMKEAVDWVADRLPDEVTARLSYDDVGRLLHWHLDYLEAEGVASESVPEVLGGTNGDGPVVLGEDDAAGYVIGRASDASLDVSDVDILLVLDAAESYLRAIGAVGGEVEPPDPLD